MKNKVLASNKGQLNLLDLPTPLIDSHEVLIEVHYSAISVGTESTIRKTTDFKSIISTAIKKVDTVKKMGVSNSLNTFKKVLEGYQPLGYSLVGRIIQTGNDALGFEIGDYVVATGAGKAIHAKYVAVPTIYLSKVKKPTAEYSLAGVTTIGINGAQKAEINVGDRVAVIGGGLIGELSAACAKLNGADVEIIEIDDEVISRLKTYNVKKKLSGNYDSIIIATNTDNTFYPALEHLKFAGNLVITGYGSTNLDRDIIEAKQPKISCVSSYGLGANNPFYELNQGDLLRLYNVNSAGRNLERAVFALDNMTIPSYKLINPKDYSEIDELLSSKKFATVIIKWKSG